MKIATLNLDWAKKGKSKIEYFLDETDFDFLILTEAIDLDLKTYPYKYFSTQIPLAEKFEGVDYNKLVKGVPPFRAIIYSKIISSKTIPVEDSFTSIALEFELNSGKIIIFATIIGTQFRKLPFVKDELNDFLVDCKNIHLMNENIFITGDLNTSFLPNEKNFSINTETTEQLKNLFTELNLINATENLMQNIDHIIIPNQYKNAIAESSIFVEKNILSDHQGVTVFLKI